MEIRLNEVTKSVLEAKPGKLADTAYEALKRVDKIAGFGSYTVVMMAAIANIDERLQSLEKERHS